MSDSGDAVAADPVAEETTDQEASQQQEQQIAEMEGTEGLPSVDDGTESQLGEEMGVDSGTSSGDDVADYVEAFMDAMAGLTGGSEPETGAPGVADGGGSTMSGTTSSYVDDNGNTVTTVYGGAAAEGGGLGPGWMQSTTTDPSGNVVGSYSGFSSNYGDPEGSSSWTQTTTDANGNTTTTVGTAESSEWMWSPTSAGPPVNTTSTTFSTTKDADGNVVSTTVTKTETTHINRTDGSSTEHTNTTSTTKDQDGNTISTTSTESTIDYDADGNVTSSETETTTTTTDADGNTTTTTTTTTAEGDVTSSETTTGDPGPEGETKLDPEEWAELQAELDELTGYWTAKQQAGDGLTDPDENPMNEGGTGDGEVPEGPGVDDPPDEAEPLPDQDSLPDDIVMGGDQGGVIDPTEESDIGGAVGPYEDMEIPVPRPTFDPADVLDDVSGVAGGDSAGLRGPVGQRLRSGGRPRAETPEVFEPITADSGSGGRSRSDASLDLGQTTSEDSEASSGRAEVEVPDLIGRVGASGTPGSSADHAELDLAALADRGTVVGSDAARLRDVRGTTGDHGGVEPADPAELDLAALADRGTVVGGDAARLRDVRGTTASRPDPGDVDRPTLHGELSTTVDLPPAQAGVRGEATTTPEAGSSTGHDQRDSAPITDSGDLFGTVHETAVMPDLGGDYGIDDNLLVPEVDTQLDRAMHAIEAEDLSPDADTMRGAVVDADDLGDLFE